MKKFAAVLAFAALALVGATDASAVPVQGGFAIGGTFQWVNNATCIAPGNCPATVLDGSANAVDFRLSPGSEAQASPGVAGPFIVLGTSGDFDVLTPFGTPGLIKDFTYAGPGTLEFPNAPISAFELAGGVTVDLLSLTFVQTTCPSGCDVAGNPALKIDGTILIHVTGFDDTTGTFNFTGNQTSGAFSFAASNGANAVPEPTSMLLLGMGLTGLVIGRKLKK